MELKVVNGLPYADGKLVMFGCSRDVDGDAEYNYACHLFPEVDWQFEHDSYIDESHILPVGTTLRGTYKEIMDFHTKEMEEGSFNDGEEMEGYMMYRQCQTDNQIMFVCNEDIEDEFLPEGEE